MAAWRRCTLGVPARTCSLFCSRQPSPILGSACCPRPAQAALEFLLRTGRQPDILHCHDWSTADVAKAYWTEYHQYGLWKPKVVSLAGAPLGCIGAVCGAGGSVSISRIGISTRVQPPGPSSCCSADHMGDRC